MNFIQTWIIAAIMLTTSFFTAHLTDPKDQPPLQRLADFPMNFGIWQGMPARFEDRIYKALGVDDSILAFYRNPQSDSSIELYIGYYQSQREGDIIHSPRNCMPGAGWNIGSIDPIVLDLLEVGRSPVTINKTVLLNGDKKQIMFYWFHSRGRIIRSEYTQKIFLVWDSIFRHRTDGSFVRIVSPVTGCDEQKTISDLKKFSETLFPILDDFIPR